MGAFIVAHGSWRWIFFVNVPLGAFSMAAVAFYLVEIREKKKGVAIDYAGALSLSITVLGLLTTVLVVGQIHDWTSTHIAALALVTVIAGYGFTASTGLSGSCPWSHGPRFPGLVGPFSSVTIFASFAYAPPPQSALGKRPWSGYGRAGPELGWSVGSLLLGQMVTARHPTASIAGGFPGRPKLRFDSDVSTATSLTCFGVFLFGDRKVLWLGTILVVQNSLSDMDLGVATASNQFSRTLGGTIGVGIGGGFFSLRFDNELDAVLKSASPSEWPAAVASQVQQSPENLFRPEIQALLSADTLQMLQEAVARSVTSVFWMVLAASILCLFLFLRWDEREWGLMSVCMPWRWLRTTSRSSRHPGENHAGRRRVPKGRRGFPLKGRETGGDRGLPAAFRQSRKGAGQARPAALKTQSSSACSATRSGSAAGAIGMNADPPGRDLPEEVRDQPQRAVGGAVGHDAEPAGGPDHDADAQHSEPPAEGRRRAGGGAEDPQEHGRQDDGGKDRPAGRPGRKLPDALPAGDVVPGADVAQTLHWPADQEQGIGKEDQHENAAAVDQAARMPPAPAGTLPVMSIASPRRDPAEAEGKDQREQARSGCGSRGRRRSASFRRSRLHRTPTAGFQPSLSRAKRSASRMGIELFRARPRTMVSRR
jgi:hypothetical protein